MFRRVLPAAVLLLVALPSGVAHGASLYPPKSVTATAASYDRINLQWSAANGTAYEVFRSTTSGGPYTRIASTASGAAC
jgi:hypothetical protein